MINKNDSFVVFPWNSNLATGIDEIDEQHKKLIELLNVLTDALVRDDAHELETVFGELADYAKYHFESEEKIWSYFFDDDPWLVSHRRTHDSFLPKVFEIQKSYSDKPLREIVERIVKFLIRWLAFHIIDNDKRMALALQHVDNGASLESAKRMSDEEMSGSTRLLIETVLNMYDGLSIRTLDLMRERLQRRKVEAKLRDANFKLEKMAVTDQLTGLSNRRKLDEVFQKELLRAKREQRVLSFIMIDIDDFKKLNDRYGHGKGDEALQLVGQALSQSCKRPADMAFRLGGEEFAVLVADQSKDTGEAIAELIRANVEQLAIPNEKSKTAPYLTVSLGVASNIPDTDDTQDYFMRVADSKLYKAKELGGNKVVVVT